MPLTNSGNLGTFYNFSKPVFSSIAGFRKLFCKGTDNKLQALWATPSLLQQSQTINKPKGTLCSNNIVLITID